MMECPKCQTNNPPESKFCMECATPFPELKEARPTKTLETPTEELRRGSVFAKRYEIIEELGKGGMGKVYRVFDKKVDGEIALKLVKPEIASDKNTVERFRNELKLARDITHKNVCRMYDLNEDKGTYYITMEYVPGGDLKRFIRRSKQLGIGTALSIAKQICEGLVEAHSLGVVHRDLKPNNIMIDDNGNARIMDFGIARSLSAKGITGKGVMIGTPEYMSPEQVEGKDVDQRSDIYSFGIIMYEMVTGRVPFEGDTPFVIGMKHKGEQPKDLKELNPQISDDLNKVILRCLEKEKENRYQDTKEVLSVLNQIEQGIPTTERAVPKSKPITSKEITVRLTSKKLFISAAIILVLTVLIFLVFAILGPGLNPRRIAVTAFIGQTGDTLLGKTGEIVADQIALRLSQVEEVEVVPATTVRQISSALDRRNRMLQGKSQAQHIAKVTGAGTIVTGKCNLLDDTLSFQIEITDAKHGKLLVPIIESSGPIEDREGAIKTACEKVVGALAYHFDVRYGEIRDIPPVAYEAYEEFLLGVDLMGVDSFQSATHFESVTKLEPDFLRPYIYLAGAYGNQGEWAKADDINSYLNQRRELLSPIERHLLDFCIARSEGNLEDSLDFIRKAEKLSPKNIISNHLVGYFAYYTNRPKECVKIHKKIKPELYEEYFSSGWGGRVWFQSLFHAHHMLGNYNRELKEIRRAKKYYPDELYEYEARALAAQGKIDKVKSIVEKIHVMTSLTNQGQIMYRVASELREHGHYEAYKEIASQAVRWFESSLTENKETVNLRFQLGIALYFAERWNEAQPIFEQLSKEYPDNIQYKGYIGAIAARNGEEEKALEVSKELKNIDIPYIRGGNTFWRACIASLLGEKGQAVSLLRDALSQGRPYGPNLLNDMDFESLRDYKPFQDLLKPKG